MGTPDFDKYAQIIIIHYKGGDIYYGVFPDGTLEPVELRSGDRDRIEGKVVLIEVDVAKGTHIVVNIPADDGKEPMKFTVSKPAGGGDVHVSR